MGEDEGDAARPSRRRATAAALALLVAAGVVVAIVVTSGSPSTPRATPGTGANASGTVVVRRRNLVATDTEAGTLSYSDPHTVYDRLSGTITWLPRVGDVIRPGGTLFAVDGEPVILLRGSTPAFRDLDSADAAGADIEQLNRNLVALGFDPNGIVIEDRWQPATTVGVQRLQESLGLAATGSLELGRIVFMPTDQIVSTVDATVGGSGGSSGGASTDPPPAHAAFVSLQQGTRTATSTTTTSARTTSATTSGSTAAAPATVTRTVTVTAPARSTPTPSGDRTPAGGGTRSDGGTPSGAGMPSGSGTPSDAGTLSALTAELKAEAAELKVMAAKLGTQQQSPIGGRTGGDTPASHGDDGGQPSTAILQTTSTRAVVTVDLSASSQSEARVGERVTVEMPAGNTAQGRISAVSRVAQSAGGTDTTDTNGGGGGSPSTVPVTITLRGHPSGAGLDQAPVSVSFAQARARHVLSVPVTALLARAGGGYAVQEAAPPHRLIRVATGLFAAGYVRISGPGIEPGLAVTDSLG